MIDEDDIRARLESADLPDAEGFQVTLGRDRTGELSAFIFVALPDSCVDGPEFGNRVISIRQAIHHLFRAHFSDCWPYVRFRKVSEMVSI